MAGIQAVEHGPGIPSHLAIWPLPLRKRHGAKMRMSGLLIYYDFDWRQVCSQKSCVPNGQRLSGQCVARCPSSKTPSLLLTTLPDSEWPTIQAPDSDWIHIANIHRVKANDFDLVAGSMSASTIRTATVVASSPGLSDSTAIGVSALLSLLKTLGPSTTAENVTSLAEVLGMACNASAENWGAFLDAVETFSDENQQLLLRRLLTNPNHLLSGSEIIGRRIAKRLDTLSKQCDELESLLKSNESACQDYLGEPEHRWLFGLEYTRVIPHPGNPRGSPDFMLERFDGYCDLVELKSPSDPIIKGAQANVDDVMPPPSGLSLSDSTGLALIQGLNYQRQMTLAQPVEAEQHGFKDTFYPTLYIVAGRQDKLCTGGKALLRQLNLSLHKTQIMPYDLLVKKARTTILGIRKRIG